MKAIKSTIKVGIIAASILAGASLVSVRASAAEAWTDRITLGADVRVRYMRVSAEGAAVDNTQNSKVRLMATGKIDENWTGNIRLTTNAGTTPTSQNITYGNAGARHAFDLDLANLDWAVMDGANLAIGRSPNPFWFAGKSEMVWDSEVSFDGLTGKWAMEMGSLKPFLNLAYITTSNSSPSTMAAETDTSMFGAQLGVTMKTDGLWGTIGISQFNHSGLKGQTRLGNTSGGTHNTSSTYTYEYYMLNPGLEIGMDIAEIPFTVFYDYVKNSDPGYNDEGGTVGLQVGKLKEKGSWTVGYFYRDVQRDAVLSGVSDGDWGGGGTATRGHKIWAGYQLHKNIALGVTTFFNTRYTQAPSQEKSYERMFFDITAAF